MKMKKNIEEYISESARIINNSIILSNNIEKSILELIKTLKNGKKIILFGNGGSAADAQHIAAELIGRFKLKRDSLPAISLTTDSSVITSIANDFSFDEIFSRQCESLVSNGDTVIGISTSGNSKNVFNGLKVSKSIGATTIGLLGNDGGIIKNIVDIPITVESSSTSNIQEAHRVIYHIICQIVESEMKNYSEKT
jgi:D-sedoheptulose 7-phosphate isomerase